MNKYLNSNFWRRLGSDLVNLIIIILLIVTFYFIQTLFDGSNLLNLIIILLFIIGIIIFNWLTLPIITKKGSIGMIIFRIKYHGDNLTNKLWKRNIVNAFFWTLSIVIIASVLLPYKNLMLNQERWDAFPMWVQITVYLMSSLICFWFLLNSFNYLFILIRPNRLGLIDIWSNLRIVNNKPIIFTLDEEYNLLPTKKEHKPVEWGDDYE